MSVTRAEVRKLAAALPDASDDSTPERLVFAINGKGFAWTYAGRVAPKKPRVAFPDVLAVRCTLESKALLIEAAPEIYFDDDHYRGYPAVLVRLKAVGKRELKALLVQAHALVAAKLKKPAKRTKAKAVAKKAPPKRRKRVSS